MKFPKIPDMLYLNLERKDRGSRGIDEHMDCYILQQNTCNCHRSFIAVSIEKNPRYKKIVAAFLEMHVSPAKYSYM